MTLLPSSCVRLLLAGTLPLAPLTQAAAQADTTSSARSLFTWRDGLLGAGFVGLTLAVRPIDKHYATRLQHPRNQQNRWFKRSAMGFNTIAVPGAFVIGGTMYAAGRLAKNERMADLGLHGTEALVIGSTLGVLLKGTFGRERPFVSAPDPNPDNFQLFRGFTEGEAYKSFPSGHTLAGFAAAAAVTAEASRWKPELTWIVGPVMYGGASLIGLSRMYDNRHWASDVIMGAAIGTFAGNKVVRYHHSNPGNRIDEWLLNFTVAPGVRGQTLSMSILPRTTYLPARPRR